MLSRADGRRAFFFTPIITACTEFGELHDRLGDMLDEDVVFVAADGNFICKKCVATPCNEMVDATLADEADLCNEDKQWRVIGAQEPELGHGDKCDHCGAFTLLVPTDADTFTLPLAVLVAKDPDPRWFGGDCNGVSHYTMTDVPTAGNAYGRTWLIRAGLVFIDDTQKPPVIAVYGRAGDSDAWPGPADPDCQGDFDD